MFADAFVAAPVLLLLLYHASVVFAFCIRLFVCTCIVCMYMHIYLLPYAGSAWP